MFHFSEQWRIKSEREALIDPASEFVGKTKIIKKPSFKDLYTKGVKVRRTKWCRGADDIENYANKMEDVTGRNEYRAYHYFCSEYKMWCTEYYKLTCP
tara:strand:- start:401 stop:694 length:294 start_codon:yes stop_codon:yes gene_type:complete